MVLQIPNVVGEEVLARLVSALDHEGWHSGKVMSRSAVVELERELLRTVEATPKFVSAALPVRCFPPLFRRLEPERQEKPRFHKAIQAIDGTAEKVRVDLIGVLALSPAISGAGEELMLHDCYGEYAFCLQPGTMLLYPASMRQRFLEPTHGFRYYAEIAVQSMVRDNAQRKILFDMDTAIPKLAPDLPESSQVDKLSGVYRRLLAYWAHH